MTVSDTIRDITHDGMLENYVGADWDSREAHEWARSGATLDDLHWIGTPSHATALDLALDAESRGRPDDAYAALDDWCAQSIRATMRAILTARARALLTTPAPPRDTLPVTSKPAAALSPGDVLAADTGRVTTVTAAPTHRECGCLLVPVEFGTLAYDDPAVTVAVLDTQAASDAATDRAQELIASLTEWEVARQGDSNDAEFDTASVLIDDLLRAVITPVPWMPLAERDA